MEVSLRVVIPSLTSRPGVHPFAQIGRAMGAVGEAALVSAPEARCDRAVRPDKLRLDNRGPVDAFAAEVLQRDLQGAGVVD